MRLLRHCVPRNDKKGVIASGAWQSRRGVSLQSFASGFCSCLIHQAQLPNKLGNYSVKNSKIKGQHEEDFCIFICHFDFLSLIFAFPRIYTLRVRKISTRITSHTTAARAIITHNHDAVVGAGGTTPSAPVVKVPVASPNTVVSFNAFTVQ